MTVLFLAPLPEPTTGHSLACKVLLDELVQHHAVEVVNLSKQDFRQGISSLSRIFEVLAIAYRAWRRRRDASIYFTVSESIAGNFKDLLVYLVLGRGLSRTVIHLHGGAGMKFLLSREHHPLLRWLNARFLRHLAGVIVLGERHQPMYSGLVDPARLHIVPNFAEDYLFTTPEHIARKFSVIRPLRVLFLSNLLPGKGHSELVAAYASLDAEWREAIEVDFAGGFESDEQRTDFLRSIAPWPRLRYHGSVRGEQKRQLFAAAHVFCLPTYYPYEGQPISIIEAYASGCAVLTTDHSGIFDVFADAVNGFAVEPRSVASLAAGLVRVAQAPQLLAEIGRNNLETAQLRYRAGDFATRLVSIISRVHDTKR